MERSKIFLGYANPEDNEFTSWLQSRLINEGYEVVTDLSMLIGGEKDFWKEIQDSIRFESIKYILVLSNHSFEKEGVIDEWEYAKSIEKEFELNDFIIPLRVDAAPYNVRIGLNKRNLIHFQDWALGFKTLLKKLYHDRVPRAQQDVKGLSMVSWIRNRYSTSHGIKKKTETFFSNWLEVGSLPKFMFLLKYDNKAQAKAVLEEENSIPIVRHDNYLISFEKQLMEFNDGYGLDIRPKKVISISTDDIFDGHESDIFPTEADSKRFIVRLLNESFQKALRQKGLNVHEMANKNQCFYYQTGFAEKDKVSFPYLNRERMKKKQLVGKMLDSKWHYGLSFHHTMYPFSVFSLKGHIIFSGDGHEIWKSASKLHSARRKKGKNLFNPDWRDLMLAFLYSLTLEDGLIHIPLSNTEILKLEPTTMIFKSHFGYEEPKENARLIPIDALGDDFDINDDDAPNEFYHGNTKEEGIRNEE